MTEIVKNRIYYRQFGPNLAAWMLCASSPEHGFLQQIAFELPPDDQLKLMDRKMLGELFAHIAAVGAVLGFRHGLVVGAVTPDISQVDPQSVWFKDETVKLGPECCAESHARRRAEEDGPESQWPPATFIDHTASSWVFKK